MIFKSPPKKMGLLEAGQGGVPEFARIRAGWGVDFPNLITWNGGSLAETQGLPSN
jgi:hypothetical protein